MPFCIAILLIEGKAGLPQFTDEVVLRKDVQSYLSRINFHVHPEAEAAGYDKMTTIIDIHMKDGRTISGRADFGKGSPVNPMTYEEVAEKFHGCCDFAKWPKKKADALVKETYSKLSPWQVAQVARHPQRPYTLEYIAAMFTDFHELHGDRSYADDPSVVGGLARFNGQSVMVIGHQKGHDTKEKVLRNFGMPRPEGYRKALRQMRTAEKFDLPVLTFVDTPGAFPGIGAEIPSIVNSPRQFVTS
jgi:hypothetical protein